MAKVYDDPSTTENEDELFNGLSGGGNGDGGWKAAITVAAIVFAFLMPGPIVMAVVIAYALWNVFRWIHVRASVIAGTSVIISVFSCLMLARTFSLSTIPGIFMYAVSPEAGPLPSSIPSRIGYIWSNTSGLLWLGVIIGCIAGTFCSFTTRSKIHHNPFFVVTKGEKYYHWRYRRTPKEMLRRHMMIKGMKAETYRTKGDSFPIGIEEEPINPPDDPAYIKYDTPIARFASEAFVHTLITGASGSGKSLHRDTPLCTPFGMKTIGDIRVGDMLFDENGRRTRVLAKYHPRSRHYEITFSDGTRIKAGGDHLWQVNETGTPDSKVVDTQTMYDCMASANRTVLYSVPLAKCVDYDEQRLPINPYAFGAWLGIRTDDELVFQGVLSESRHITDDMTADANITPRFDDSGKTANNPYERFAEDIPDVYLISSKEQRMRFLEGFLDVAGIVGNHGDIEVNMTDARIAGRMRMMVCSLGWLATEITENPSDDGKNGSQTEGRRAFRFSFHPDRNVFTVKHKHDELQRHLDREAMNGTEHERSRSIVSIVPLHDDGEDYYCLTVDSPSHLFLCSESFIPTHNTITMQNAIRHNMEDRQTIFIIDCKADPNFASKMASWSNELGLNFYHFAPTMGNEYRITQNPAGPAFYDPLAHGRAADHTDMLISTREWDAASAVYKANAQSMLSTVFAIMEEMNSKDPSLSDIDFSRGTMYTFYELIRNESNLASAIGTIPSQSQTRLLADELETLIHATNRTREAQGVQNAMGEYKGFMRGLMTSDGRYMVYPKSGNRKVIDVFKLASEPGNVVLFSISATKSTDIGAMVGSMICTDLTNMTAMRAISGQTNPVSIYVDEFQSLPPTAVKSMLEKARSAKIGITLAFQSLEQVTASTGTDAFINALLDTCGNFIFHAGSNETTAQTMSQIIGKHWTNQYAIQRRNQQGMFELNWSNKRNANVMTNQVEKYIIEPSAFQHLSAPRKENGFKSEAIVIKKSSSDSVDKNTTGPVAHKVWMIPPDLIIDDDYFDPNAPVMDFKDEPPETGVDEHGDGGGGTPSGFPAVSAGIGGTANSIDAALFNDGGSTGMEQQQPVMQSLSNGMPVPRRHPQANGMAKPAGRPRRQQPSIDDSLFNGPSPSRIQQPNANNANDAGMSERSPQRNATAHPQRSQTHTANDARPSQRTQRGPQRKTGTRLPSSSAVRLHSRQQAGNNASNAGMANDDLFNDPVPPRQRETVAPRRQQQAKPVAPRRNKPVAPRRNNG